MMVSKGDQRIGTEEKLSPAKTAAYVMTPSDTFAQETSNGASRPNISTFKTIFFAQVGWVSDPTRFGKRESGRRPNLLPAAMPR